MISRVADSCFWLGRYLERVEATAGLLQATRNLSMDAEMEPRQCWLPVIMVIGEAPQRIDRTTEHPIGATSGEQVERYVTWDESNMASIRCSVGAARENARSIREVISLEVWEPINELYLWLGSQEARTAYRDARDSFYRHIRQRCQLIAGLLRSTMLHEPPLNFIWLGMLLERAGQTARVVDVQHHVLSLFEQTHQVIETALWLSLLRACAGLEPFMQKNHGRVSGDAVASFLIFAPNFPKSVAYGVREALQRYTVIRPADDASLPGGQSMARLRALDRWIGEAAERGMPGDVHELLTHVIDEIDQICNSLGQDLFGQAPTAAMESAQ